MRDDRAQERVIDAKFNDSNPKYIAVTIGLGSMAPNGNIMLTMTGNAGIAVVPKFLTAIVQLLQSQFLLLSLS